MRAVYKIVLVFRLLEMKEKDLELAAELGKALLQRNEELRRKNEELAEEYSNKLEVGSLELLDKVSDVPITPKIKL